jgi:hypothetical protein
VSLFPVRGFLGLVNALDEGKGEWTEEVLSGPFFSCDRGGPADERSKARSRSSSAGKHWSTVRSTLGAFGCACGIGDSDGRQLVEVDGAGDGPCDDNRGGGEGQGELPAGVYDVPMPGTVKLAEEDSGPDPPPLVPVLAF